MKLRLIDAGTVSGLRSQSIYHGLAYAQLPKTPNTIVLVTPGTPYMCVGFFQDVKNELDIKYCNEKKLPIIRRETGGGAVYIDKGQLFVQWIFQESSLPRRVDKRFEIFVKPLIETYKFFGIDAYHHPINDVHVNGKKIVGTGAGTIGEAQVVTGNFLFDFNYATMIDSINVPNGNFRNAVARNLDQYLTNMKKELQKPPGREDVRDIYFKKCEEILGLKVELGSFTDKELKEIEKIEEKFTQDTWIYQTKRKPSINKLFKIHLGVWIGYMNHDFKNGSMSALITMKDDCISEIKLDCSGWEISNISIKKLENRLIGVEMDKELLISRIESEGKHSINKEWLTCIYQMKELQLQQIGHGELARSN
jgi:lipoate-protein ligase A